MNHGPAFFLIAATAFASMTASAQEMGDARKGEALAQSICSECHVVDSIHKPSPNTKAPNFVDVAKSPGMTPLALRVWLQSPHPTMPNIILTDEQKDDVIAYLLSLKIK